MHKHILVKCLFTWKLEASSSLEQLPIPIFYFWYQKWISHPKKHEFNMYNYNILLWFPKNIVKRHLNVIFETHLFTKWVSYEDKKEYIQEILKIVLWSQLLIIFNNFLLWIHNMYDPPGTLSLSPYWYLTQVLRATKFTLNTNLWWCPLFD